jgi:hypothetical protein
VTPLFPTRAAAWLYTLLLLATVVFCYRPVLSYPFVQDDWGLVDAVVNFSNAEYIARFGLPHGRLMYRPLSMGYHLVVQRLCGPNPVVVHALAMAWLALCAGLTARVLFHLTGDRVLALSSGLLFIGATPIHANAMMWAVGVNALLGPAFALASFLLHLGGRTRWAALVFLAACFFYEGAVFFPAVFLLHAWLTGGSQRGIRRIVHAVRVAAPSLIALAIVFLPKLQTANPAGLPAAHPYSAQPFTWRVLVGLAHYARWMLDGLFPWLAECPAKERLFEQALVHHAGLLALAVALALSAAALAMARRRPASWVAWLTLMAWSVLALTPFVTLVNHAYRYFLIYALTPVLGLALGAALAVLRRRLAAAPVAAAAVLLCALHVLAGERYIAHRDAEGLNSRFTDGTCSLVHKARIVTLAQQALRDLGPRLPPGAHVVFGNVEVWSFRREYGPRLWTGDRALDVINAYYTGHDEKGAYVEGDPADPVSAVMGVGEARRYLDIDKLFVLWLVDGMLVDRTAEFRAAWGPAVRPQGLAPVNR